MFKYITHFLKINTNKRQQLGKQHGRTLLEMLGVLAIIGVLSITALVGFTYAMNKHRANETIYDVMLRAANVPMTDEYYQKRPTGYAFRFPELGNETSSLGYRLETVKNEAYGYVYRVDAPSLPPKVCELILRLEPTDIDEIRVGTNGSVYTRGAWDLCSVSSDSVSMSFYFEKLCETGTDCSSCQECRNGQCKANYSLPGCGTNTPDIPPSTCTGSDCDEDGNCTGSDCTICVGKDCGEDGTCVGPDCKSCTGSDCGPDGECIGENCVNNPNIPPSVCVGSDCDADGNCTGSDCTVCVGKDCGEDGTCVGPDCKSCTGSDCGENGECIGENCIENPFICADAPSCGQCQKYTYGTDGCPNGCEDIDNCDCPDLSCSGDCTTANYETCTCEVIPNCRCSGLTCGTCETPNYNTCTCDTVPDCTCPDFAGCSDCEDIVYDTNNCPISCQSKICEVVCEAPWTGADIDACGCPTRCDCSLSCTEPCTQLNTDTCTCEVIPNCTCPETPVCKSCETLSVDENNCPVCVSTCSGTCSECTDTGCEDRTVQIQTGTCCDDGEVSCCPLTDQCDVCTIADMNQCQCEDGYQRAPNGECLECPIQNLATGNYYGICQHADGRYACCCQGGAPNWHVKQDDSGDCILCELPKVFDGYNDCKCENGNDCGATCCTEDETCINGSSCCPTARVCANELFSICCQEGEMCVNNSCCDTPNADATECCSYGVGTNGECCTVDPATCTNGTTTDDNGCTVCKEETCPADKPVACTSGTDTWCCAEGNTCGSTAGQCCLGGNCCSDGGTRYCEHLFEGQCNSGYLCCPSNKTVVSSIEGEDYTVSLCCPKGDRLTIWRTMYTRGCNEDGCADYSKEEPIPQPTCSSDAPCPDGNYYITTIAVGGNTIDEILSCSP